MNQQEAKQLLESIGYEQVESGKHQIKMNKPGVLRPIVLSHHRGQQYSRDLTARILKEAGLFGAEGSDHVE
jgi:predicted RNA binding protein YcfA (HicA-like mRNA interferase family)